MDTLIDAAALQVRLDAAKEPASTRWCSMSGGRSATPTATTTICAVHIPGAVFVDLATELAGPADPERGRHPLPPPEQFQESARGWGINDGDAVVVYDDSGNMAAARLWWMLRNAGFPVVHLLDGGLAAWRAAGFALDAGSEQPAAGNVTLGGGPCPRSTPYRPPPGGSSGLLLDARAGSGTEGKSNPWIPAPGISLEPSAPHHGNLRPDGRFLAPTDLRARFERLGYRPVPTAVYCGSGVTAAHEIAALEIAGLPAALYPGSFSEWCHDASNEVVTGASPYGEDTASN